MIPHSETTAASATISSIESGFSIVEVRFNLIVTSRWIMDWPEALSSRLGPIRTAYGPAQPCLGPARVETPLVSG